MLSLEVLLHELLVEDFSSDSASRYEPCHDELEHDYNDGEAHISVKINLLLVSEEHQEESQWRVHIRHVWYSSVSISHGHLRRERHIHCYFI